MRSETGQTWSSTAGSLRPHVGAVDGVAATEKTAVGELAPGGCWQCRAGTRGQFPGVHHHEGQLAIVMLPANSRGRSIRSGLGWPSPRR